MARFAKRAGRSYIWVQMSDFVRPHYSKPPIAEAIIDIRFADPDSVTIERLADVAGALAESYPVKQPIRHFEIGFQADTHLGNAQFINNQAQTGWRLVSKEQDRVLQLQRIGFTYSHLPPYSSWEKFRDDARQGWKMFKSRFPNQGASRVAVRIINKIPVPSEGYSVKDYISLYPVMPEQIPSPVDAIFLQAQMGMPNIFPDARAILNVVTGQADQNGSHLVLDIDLFVERSIKDDEEVWSILEKFGIEKDVIFEACITDEVRKAIA
jgi:uncharacterized protein (TIGR04255 family)